MALIKLNYGPYEANGIIRHRPQRLHGLITSLTAKGYPVEIIASEHLNRLTVNIYGVVVFRCDIRNLLFNVGAEDDVVCQRALEAIEEATKRFFDETNIPKFVSVKRGMRFIEKKKLYHTSDYLTASNVALLFEIQDQYKEPEEQVGPPTKVKDSSVKFDKPTEGTDDVSAISMTDNRVDPSRSSTYDRTIESSAPTSSLISSTYMNAKPATIKEDTIVPEAKEDEKASTYMSPEPAEVNEGAIVPETKEEDEKATTYVDVEPAETVEFAAVLETKQDEKVEAAYEEAAKAEEKAEEEDEKAEETEEKAEEADEKVEAHKVSSIPFSVQDEGNE